MKRVTTYPKGLDVLQKISVSLMAFLVVLTFVGANLHALLWQQSAYLVSTVLPAVVVEMTNEERQQLNAPNLRRNPTLDEAARLKAEHMAENEYFSHYSPTGVSPWYWFSEAGYRYAHAGENLAIHFTDSSEVVDAWMKSPTHRANIVNANYTEIGVGTAKGTYEGYDTVYVVQLFGTPAGPTPATSPVPPTPEPVATTAEADELASLAEQANELAELVASLEAEAEPAPNPELEPVAETETPVVLSGTEPAEILVTDNFDTLPAPVETPPVVVTDTVVEPEPTANEDIVPTEATEVPDVTPAPTDVLVVESTIATSSGLTAATLTTLPGDNAGATAASLATQPNQVLQIVYLVLGIIVMLLLLFSAVFEARQLHFVQVAYSFGLMVSMGALWYVHNLLTAGALIA
jgi:hypothetical protein